MERRVHSHSNPREVLPPLQLEINRLEYLAGLFDVSGSITIEKNQDKRTQNPRYSYPLRVELQRVDAGTVDLFKNLVPGYGNDRTLPSGKVTDRWFVKARKARLLLETLGSHFRLKAGHWETVSEYINTADNRPQEDSERLKGEIIKLNDAPKVSFNTPLTDPYLAGVFDGHGLIDIHARDRNLNLTAKIGMWSEPFMTGIAEYTGTTLFPDRSHGVIHAYIVSLSSERAENFLRRIQPYSIRYKGLISLALNFQEIWEQNKRKKRPEEQVAKIKEAQRLFLETRDQIRTGSPR